LINTLTYHKTKSQNLILGSMGIALLAFAVVSLSLGAYLIPVSNVLGILTEAIGFTTFDFAPQQSNVLLQIRLPRIVLAILVGGGLGVTGAALQGLFRNPLVEPGLIGVSSGGALFAVIFIVLGSSLPFLAFSEE
jgi:iron complex transport system permease protein